MVGSVLVWFLLSWPPWGGDPSRERYLDLLWEKENLAHGNRRLSLEAARDSAKTIYLVVDLEKAELTLKVGGIPLRQVPIVWSFGSKDSRKFFDFYQVAEVEEAGIHSDSTLADSGGINLRQLADLPSHRWQLQRGPELWVTRMPRMKSRLDTLKVRTWAWVVNSPFMADSSRFQFFVSEEDEGWITGAVGPGNWVLFIPPGPEPRQKAEQEKIPKKIQPTPNLRKPLPHEPEPAQRLSP